MDVELLVVKDCAHGDAAAALLRTALDDIGLAGTAFTVDVIETTQQADLRGFIGSPSFMADGVDLFPQPQAPAAVACRTYRRSNHMSGLPDLRDLRQALKQAAHASSERPTASPSA